MNHQPSTINLFINGTPCEVPTGITVQALLALREVEPRGVAVEVGGTIVPKSAYAEMRLSPEDKVEIIGFIGGG